VKEGDDVVDRCFRVVSVHPVAGVWYGMDIFFS